MEANSAQGSVTIEASVPQSHSSRVKYESVSLPDASEDASAMTLNFYLKISRTLEEIEASYRLSESLKRGAKGVPINISLTLLQY